MTTREQVLKAAEYVNKAAAIDAILDARYERTKGPLFAACRS
jgi:hypothetical protein